MENPAPFEILAAPFSAFLAPVGTAFPAIDAAPGGAWTLLGTSGPLDYSETGVTVEHTQTIALFRSLGSTGPRKASRTQEDQKISLELVDLTLEQYAKTLNDNAITAVGHGVGVAGTKKVGLSRGQTVAQHALLLRGPSPYMEAGAAQYEVPVCIQSGSPKPVFGKDVSKPAALAIEFTALEDPAAASPDERFGRFVAETAPAD